MSHFLKFNPLAPKNAPRIVPITRGCSIATYILKGSVSFLNETEKKAVFTFLPENNGKPFAVVVARLRYP